MVTKSWWCFSLIRTVSHHFAAMVAVMVFFSWALADDCQCEKIQCGSCEEQVSLSFYTEKCAGGQRVKSCSRPACRPLNPLPPSCKGREVEKAPSEEAPAREVASASSASGRVVGRVTMVRGEAFQYLQINEKKVMKVGAVVRQGETLVTGVDGHAKVVLINESVLNLVPKSKLVLTDFQFDPKQNENRSLLDLIYGRLRSSVKPGERKKDEFSFRVRTRAAVAGVRGTEFWVSYFEGDKSMTRVDTVKGLVVLSARDHEKAGVEIPIGHRSSLIVEVPKELSMARDSQLEGTPLSGEHFLTPVYESRDEDLIELERLIIEEQGAAQEHLGGEENRLGRSLASVSAVCSSPSAELNTCAWFCENNPAGSSRCLTENPKVRCVRKKCNANGQWAEESQLPASFSQYCKGDGPRVGPCDY